MMETAADFGVVDFFAVQTLTTGIFSTWLEAHNAGGGAAQIALVVLALVLLLVGGLEKLSRRRSRFYNLSRAQRPIEPVRLTGLPALLAFLLCAVPFAVGFVLPVGVMLSHAFANPESWFEPGLLRALAHTVSVGGGVAAVVTVIAALFLVYGVRLGRSRAATVILPFTTLGYAARRGAGGGRHPGAAGDR